MYAPLRHGVPTQRRTKLGLRQRALESCAVASASPSATKTKRQCRRFREECSHLLQLQRCDATGKVWGKLGWWDGGGENYLRRGVQRSTTQLDAGSGWDVNGEEE
jgi:hypothetical protein